MSQVLTDTVRIPAKQTNKELKYTEQKEVGSCYPSQSQGCLHKLLELTSREICDLVKLQIVGYCKSRHLPHSRDQECEEEIIPVQCMNRGHNDCWWCDLRVSSY